MFLLGLPLHLPPKLLLLLFGLGAKNKRDDFCLELSSMYKNSSYASLELSGANAVSLSRLNPWW